MPIDNKGECMSPPFQIDLLLEIFEKTHSNEFVREETTRGVKFVHKRTGITVYFDFLDDGKTSFDCEICGLTGCWRKQNCRASGDCLTEIRNAFDKFLAES